MTADEFWRWFALNNRRFRDLGAGAAKEALLDELMEHLHAYCDGLWFETGGHPLGPRELVITAEGNRDFFSRVNALVARAPSVDGWKFIAFKPAHGFGFVTEYSGLRLDPSEMWFLPLGSQSAPTSLGLRVSSPHFEHERRNDFLTACHLVLECALGELSAAEDVQHLEVGTLPANPAEAGWIELPELTEYIRWRRRQGEV